MKKLKLTSREIGTVSVFDLEGMPTEQTLQEIATKIQRRIRRHRIQRVILNLQNMDEVDPVGLRKLLAACLRPQSSLIYGASADTEKLIEDAYLPTNVRLCNNEEQVAERFGPFLLEKDATKEISMETVNALKESIGKRMERRRAKRMHVAIPVEFTIYPQTGAEPIVTRAIITNISEGGLFAEYLDLDQAKEIDVLDPVVDMAVDILIPKCGNFPEEYRVKGRITRKELRKKQLGLGVRFVE